MVTIKPCVRRFSRIPYDTCGRIKVNVEELAQRMADAVKAGDMAAARALADLLQEEVKAEYKVAVSGRRIACDLSRVKVVLYVKDGMEMDEDDVQSTRDAIDGWMRDGGAPVLMLRGVDRVEIFEVDTSGQQSLDTTPQGLSPDEIMRRTQEINRVVEEENARRNAGYKTTS
jgi:hypothetical protein